MSRKNLTEEQAVALREYAARHPSLSARQIALERGMAVRTVQHILSGYSFPLAGGPRRAPGERGNRVNLTKRSIDRIRRLRGERTAEGLADEYGCSASLIKHIWTNRVYRSEPRR